VAATFTVVCHSVLLNVFSDIVSISVFADPHLPEAGPGDFEAWIDWFLCATKKKTHKTIGQFWKWLCRAYSVLAGQPVDCSTTQQVRRGTAFPSARIVSTQNLMLYVQLGSSHTRLARIYATYCQRVRLFRPVRYPGFPHSPPFPQ
jgi:hypothetical protein